MKNYSNNDTKVNTKKKFIMIINQLFACRKGFRLSPILISLVVLLSTFGVDIPGDTIEPVDSPALVRIGLTTPSDLATLAELNLYTYAQLASPDGDAFLLASADNNQQAALTLLGFPLVVLDLDSHGKTYHLLYGLPDVLHDASVKTRLLYMEGRYAIANLTPIELSLLSTMDLQIRPLTQYPLSIPGARSYTSLASNLSLNPLIREMVDQLDAESLYYLDGSLSGEWSVNVDSNPYTIKTRYTYSDVPIKKATRYAYEYFQSLGLPVGYDHYEIDGLEKRSVVSEQAGLTQPERIFLLTAHIDSTSQNPYTYAPGADDNASGSAGLMVIADILSRYKFGCTLRYLLFTGEEQGYYGSMAYAEDASKSGENIEAVLNLDMIGYNTLESSPTLELHTRWENESDLAIANLFVEAVDTYQIDLIPNILQDGKAFSDHASFWQYGYPSILAIEDWEDHTPFYHSTSDQLETLNMAYMTEFAKAATATFAHMGCLLQGELSGIITDASTGTPISGAYIKAKSENGMLWSTNTKPDGSFHMTLIPDSYRLFIAAPNFRSETLEDIQVINEQTTTQDYALQPNILDYSVYLPNIKKNAP